jgi:hypothetical protein
MARMQIALVAHGVLALLVIPSTAVLRQPLTLQHCYQLLIRNWMALLNTMLAELATTNILLPTTMA